MIDLITMWARRADCPTCYAAAAGACFAKPSLAHLELELVVHEARVAAHPVAAALHEAALDAARAEEAASFEGLVAAAVVAVAELAAHDAATCRVLFDAFAAALGRAQGGRPS